jgi:hypothetical protein
MAGINVDELGPVDYLVGRFPADNANFSGEMASELKTLIDRNTVRVLRPRAAAALALCLTRSG